MSASPLIGPVDGAVVRLWEAEPGRLAIDDLAAGVPGSGWVEPVGVSGSTAWVRISTAAVGSDVAVAAAVEAVVAQVRSTGARRLVLEPDPEDHGRILRLVAVADLDVIVVPPTRVTNSLGRRVERFVAMRPGRVGLYSCGPTVYSFAHLGNMRPYVFADTLKRTLQWRGLQVDHVINITDVGHLLADADQGEDKVEEASRREGRSVEEITGVYAAAFWDDLHALQVRDADQWPKASAYVPEMINFGRVLQDRGYGYVLPEGLYFDTSLQADYGELAGIDTAGQRETGRVETVAGKRSKSDFALWRTFTDGRVRLMRWDSPWGVGAPGWHLECSVMSMSLLGDHFDVHTGGIDHRALHHVNEIAQSEAYLGDGRPWVRYWMHNEFLRFGGAKMAKSEGGILRLADLVALGVHPLAFRYLLLQSHYASQLDFTEKLAANAHVALKRLSSRVRAALGGAAGRRELSEAVTLADSLDQAAALGSDLLRERLLALDAQMADDLHTPEVLALVQDWSRRPDDLAPAEWEVLVRAANTLTGLSLGQLGVADFAPPLPDTVDVDWVEDLVVERDRARAASDWDTADRMRAELAAAGIKVDDTPAGSHWYWAGPR